MPWRASACIRTGSIVSGATTGTFGVLGAAPHARYGRSDRDLHSAPPVEGDDVAPRSRGRCMLYFLHADEPWTQAKARPTATPEAHSEELVGSHATIPPSAWNQ